MIRLPSLPYSEPLPEAVLFAFDDACLPFRSQVEHHLIAANPTGGASVVLEHGPEGSHDEVLLYYGTVIRDGDKFRMWYNGNYGPLQNDTNIERKHCVICYAESTDGVHWEKPELGLVEFNGSKANNIVDLDIPKLWSTAAILLDPDDPDPNRRYKFACETGLSGPNVCVAFSADGFRWTPFSGNPVPLRMEMAGITKFRGLYYLNGQITLPLRGRRFARRLLSVVSSDFEHWSPIPAIGLDRSPDLTGPSTDHLLVSGPYDEIHLGAGLWNRGNVLLGIYGQWHGHESGDRRMVTIDLGLALSHDAIHFKEPIPGFPFIPAREQPGSPDISYWPALQQGQGMENVGDRTLYWYSLWRGTPGSGVRMVSWERDRLGYLAPYMRGTPRVTSCPIEVTNGTAKLAVNVSGLGEHATLRVSLLDDGFHPIPGASGDAAAVVTESGLSVPISFDDRVLDPQLGRFRVEIAFEGLLAQEARLHALYVN